MKKGIPKIDGIAVGEFEGNFLGPSPRLKAKAAFVDSHNGSTHGWTTCEQWSPTTIQKLKEFRAAMEEDLAGLHFQDSDSEFVDTSDVSSRSAEAPTGLGEHLNKDADSV